MITLTQNLENQLCPLCRLKMKLIKIRDEEWYVCPNSKKCGKIRKKNW